MIVTVENVQAKAAGWYETAPLLYHAIHCGSHMAIAAGA